MNSLTVLCLVLCCAALGQAMMKKSSYNKKRPFPIRYCYDFMGRPVMPGQSFNDGCNQCVCGSFGQATACTMRFCPDIKPIKPIKPIYPKPIRPVYPKPIRPIYPKPIRPIYPKPIKPIKPIYPVRPIKPIKPIYPVRPIKPIKPVKPIYPVKPIRPIRPIKPIKPIHSGIY